MPDAAYAAFIEDCRRVRASLIGLVEAIENKMLAPGMPIAIPESMDTPTAMAVAGFKRTVIELGILIKAHEDTQNS